MFVFNLIYFILYLYIYIFWFKKCIQLFYIVEFGGAVVYIYIYINLKLCYLLKGVNVFIELVTCQEMQI